MATTTLYRPDVILAAVSPLSRGDDIVRFNRELESAGLGRPLQPPAATTASHVIIPTTVDAALVRNALKHLRLPGSDVDRFDLDYQYVPGTTGTSARGGNFDYYLAAGCKTGHGTAAWLPAPKYVMPPKPLWERPAVGTRPVIALLDEGVEEHEWLPEPSDRDPFGQAWEPSQPLGRDGLGVYRGHGTFNAGIIRYTAPQARLLSMRVMGVNGRVAHSRLVEALDELIRRKEEGNPVDIICLPFGRHRDGADDDEALATIKEKLGRLNGIPVVASAGNGGVESPVYPAAFAPDAEVSVISVGSSEPDFRRAPYSNFGVWVSQWRGGTNMLSSMPMPCHEQDATKDGYAWWSGTSFAAVRYAGEIAARLSIA